MSIWTKVDKIDRTGQTLPSLTRDFAIKKPLFVRRYKCQESVDSWRRSHEVRSFTSFTITRRNVDNECFIQPRPCLHFFMLQLYLQFSTVSCDNTVFTVWLVTGTKTGRLEVSKGLVKSERCPDFLIHNAFVTQMSVWYAQMWTHPWFAEV